MRPQINMWDHESYFVVLEADITYVQTIFNACHLVIIIFISVRQQNVLHIILNCTSATVWRLRNVI